MKKNYVEIKNDNLVFAFDEVSQGENFKINFQRTLRIPDDNKKYFLPPGLGNFPLAHVEDYSSKVPEQWNEHGGIFFPMYQAEAMWMSFTSSSGRPYAVKIAAGKINAVSGESWDNKLHGKLSNVFPEKPWGQIHRPILNDVDESKPDYMVCPKQPWLDGFNVGKGSIRQFISMPLGSGYTVEEQVTHQAEHGGIQIIVYPMKNELWEKIKPKNKIVRVVASSFMPESSRGIGVKKSVDMGLAAGGIMKQDIYEDTYGLDAWHMDSSLRVFVHLTNSKQYENITGKKPPNEPPSPEEYRNYSYPWFDYYSDEPVLAGSDILAKVDSVASMQTKKDEQVLPDDGMKPGLYQKPILINADKKKVKDTNKW